MAGTRPPAVRVGTDSLPGESRSANRLVSKRLRGPGTAGGFCPPGVQWKAERGARAQCQRIVDRARTVDSRM